MFWFVWVLKFAETCVSSGFSTKYIDKGRFSYQIYWQNPFQTPNLLTKALLITKFIDEGPVSGGSITKYIDEGPFNYQIYWWRPFYLPIFWQRSCKQRISYQIYWRSLCKRRDTHCKRRETRCKRQKMRWKRRQGPVSGGLITKYIEEGPFSYRIYWQRPF